MLPFCLCKHDLEADRELGCRRRRDMLTAVQILSASTYFMYQISNHFLNMMTSVGKRNKVRDDPAAATIHVHVKTRLRRLVNQADGYICAGPAEPDGVCQ
jgi:hypothetical protein